MPRFILLLVILLVAGSHCWANDGAFYGASGILKPQKNTRISIQREWLSFDLTKEHAEIRVRFHFFNPDDTAIVLPVGFYVPRSCGDVDFSDIQHPAVELFTTVMNGRVLPYELRIQRCDTCILEDTAAVFADEIPNDNPNADACGSDFVFLSNMSFQPGVNVVTHSYRQRPNNSIAYPAEYPYIVRTVSRWAGGKIDTLECEFSAPRDMLCFVQGTHDAASTHVLGSAREFTAMQLHPYWDEINVLEPECAMVRAPNGEMVNEYYCRLFRIRDARVRFAWSSFRPTDCFDLSFTLLDIATYLTRKDRELSIVDSSAHRDRLARNTLYAIHGLMFRDPDLQSYFDKQEWYIGDPNVRASSISFNKDEREMLDLLLSRDNVSKP